MGRFFSKLASMGRCSCFRRRPQEGGQGDLPDAADADGGGAQSQGAQNVDGEPAQNVTGGGPGDLLAAADAGGGGAPSQDAHEPRGPGQTTSGQATSIPDHVD